MFYKRMPIEIEAPVEFGHDKIRFNLSESSCANQTLETLGLQIPNLTFFYNEHRGNTKLRKLIVQDADDLNENDVLITSGAAGALFIISTSQLVKSDNIVVVRPNYATNIETPRAIGCDISLIDLSFDSDFQPDVTIIEKAIKANTKLVSITCPNNPTGTLMSEADLRRLVEVTRERGCLLLVDETYRDISYGRKLPIAATLGDHVISVCSLSKSYGAPGLRLGWIIIKSKELQRTFLAAKEQISISGSVMDEWVAEEIMSRKHSILATIQQEMALRRDIVEAWVAKEDLVEWVKPDGGMVCFPHMKKEPSAGTQAFYDVLVNKYGTYVGAGHWFEMPDTFFRVGFGLTSRKVLEEGLANISKALRDVQ